jgi:hypothetical protein
LCYEESPHSIQADDDDDDDDDSRQYSSKKYGGRVDGQTIIFI